MNKFPSCRRFSLLKNQGEEQNFFILMERWTELVTTLLCFSRIHSRRLSTPHSKLAWKTNKIEHTICFAEMQIFFSSHSNEKYIYIYTYNIKKEVGASVNEWFKGFVKKKHALLLPFTWFWECWFIKASPSVVINDFTSFYRNFKLEAKFYMIMASNCARSSSFCKDKWKMDELSCIVWLWKQTNTYIKEFSLVM